MINEDEFQYRTWLEMEADQNREARAREILRKAQALHEDLVQLEEELDRLSAKAACPELQHLLSELSGQLESDPPPEALFAWLDRLELEELPCKEEHQWY